MGLGIGQVTGALSALRSSPEFGQARLRRQNSAVPGADEPSNRPGPTPPRRGEAPDLRVGFGENTISPLSAALRTIDRTIQRVRENQPTLDEIREQFQLRAAERRAEIRKELLGPLTSPQEPSATDEQRGIPQASPRVREFAATDPADEFQPIEPAPREREVRVNAPNPAEVRAQRIEATPEPQPERPRLDVLV